MKGSLLAAPVLQRALSAMRFVIAFPKIESLDTVHSIAACSGTDGLRVVPLATRTYSRERRAFVRPPENERP